MRQNATQPELFICTKYTLSDSYIDDWLASGPSRITGKNGIICIDILGLRLGHGNFRWAKSGIDQFGNILIIRE